MCMARDFHQVSILVVHILMRRFPSAVLALTLLAIVDLLPLRIPFPFIPDDLAAFPVNHLRPLTLTWLRYRLIRPNEATHADIST